MPIIFGAAATALAPLLSPTGRENLRGAAVLAFVTIGSARVLRDRRIEPQPWYLVLAGSTAGFIGTLIAAFVYSYEIPSPADPIILAGYVLVIFGLRSLRRKRHDRFDIDEILDAGLVASAAGVVIFAGLLSSYFVDPAIAPIQRITNACYAALTVAMIGAIARLAVAPGTRNTSWRLMGISVVTIVACDILVIIGTSGAQWSYTTWTIIGASPYFFATAAILHPSVQHLTDPPPDSPPGLSRVRIVLVACALLVVPVVYLATALSDRPPNQAIVALGSAALSTIALARLTRLFRVQEAASRVDTYLRESASSLLSTVERDEIARTAMSSAKKLLQEADLDAQVEFWQPDRLQELLRGATDANDRMLTASAAMTKLLRQVGAPVITTYDERYNCNLVAVRIGDSEGSPIAVLIGRTSQPTTKLIERSLAALGDQTALAMQTASLALQLARTQVEQRFRSLIENSNDIFMILDEDGTIVFASPAFQRILGAHDPSGHPTSIFDVIADEDMAFAARSLAWLTNAREVFPIEVRFSTGSMSARWFELSWRDLRDQPEIAGIVVNARDVSERRSSDEKIAMSEARFRALVQHSGDLIIVINDSLHITFASPQVSTLLGRRTDEVLGRPVGDLLGESFSIYLPNPTTPFSQFEFETTVAGVLEPIDFSFTIADLRDVEAVSGIVITGRDVTAQRKMEENLERQKHTDALTGLLNRDGFRSRLHDQLQRSSARFNVLLVNLDDFKALNDGLGHAVADELLAAIATRLTTGARFDDAVARLQADEFAVLLADSGRDEALSFANRLLDELSLPIISGGNTVVVTACIGLTVADPGSSADDVLLNAASALRASKLEGKSIATAFEPRMRDSALERFSVVSGLRHAISGQQMVDFYQPKVDLSTGKIVGAEVLVRWHHPDKGLLAPGSFIPLAEETGLIVQLGHWVLEQALLRLKSWQRHARMEHLHMSINVSARQLQSSDAIRNMMDLISASGLSPSSIVLELTESLFVADDAGQLDALSRLNQAGIQLSIDDFGTGYSNLGYLSRLPINEVKIDRSFVRNVDRSINRRAVLQHVVELTRDLGITTTAEGIESEEELRVVKELGCNLGQGYYFSRPVPAPVFMTLLDPLTSARTSVASNGKTS